MLTTPDSVEIPAPVTTKTFEQLLRNSDISTTWFSDTFELSGTNLNSCTQEDAFKLKVRLKTLQK